MGHPEVNGMMEGLYTTLLASFTYPVHMGASHWSQLWIVPLLASIATVYKATKVNSIDAKRFPRETLGLFCSILVFIIIAALVLVSIAWIVNDLLPMSHTLG
jgi:hypothetical protein